jgi:hypothetical protein
MTRAATGDTVTLPPSNNVYTVLLGAALICVILGLVVVFMRANAAGIKFF